MWTMFFLFNHVNLIICCYVCHIRTTFNVFDIYNLIASLAPIRGFFMMLELVLPVHYQLILHMHLPHSHHIYFSVVLLIFPERLHFTHESRNQGLAFIVRVMHQLVEV